MYSYDLQMYFNGAWQDTAYPGKKFRDILQAPVFIEEKLDDTLDTAQVSFLYPWPLPFTPKTKVRLFMWTNKDRQGDPAATWDFIVEKDNVEHYIGYTKDPKMYMHRINLIEASAIAQGMICDNIALTYELRDVDLNYKTIPDPTGHVEPALENSKIWSDAVRLTEPNISPTPGGVQTIVTYFQNSYRYEWDVDSMSDVKNLSAELDASISHPISFSPPHLWCEGCYTPGKFERLFEVPTFTSVREIIVNGQGQEVSNTFKTSNNSYPNDLPVKNDEVMYSDGQSASIRSVKSWDLRNPSEYQFNQHFDIMSPMSKSLGRGDISFNTATLDSIQLANGYSIRYEIRSYFQPVYPSSATVFYEKKHTSHRPTGSFPWESTAVTSRHEEIDPSTVFVSAHFIVRDTTVGHNYPFTRQPPKKYSAAALIRKALLAADTRVIDITTTGLDPTDGQGNNTGIVYPIKIADEWIGRLEQTQTFETVFEQKNLWEILLQVGKYIHAIPYLEFDDNSDGFILRFRQLGDTTVQPESGKPITVFNSQDLNEYFASFDSYVTNFYSPQNVVEEYLVPKTSDSTFLVSNNTAELHTSKPILEIEGLWVTYDPSANNSGGVAGEKEITHRIFERSIYDILTSEDPREITPSKGDSIYFTLGDTKIQGLSYEPPGINSGDMRTALQQLISEEFLAAGNAVIPQNIKFNDLLFRIRYRTQDTLRVAQYRPDLFNYLKNSSLETYPKHEQVYGQQDKMVDSERYSANLMGQLVRVGNVMYQTQEKVTADVGKKAGQLFIIDGDPYYITEIDNEYHQAIILQKITLSKNFNQLSQVVTIPSEPRFYEVSERSQVRREIKMQEFIRLSSVAQPDAQPKFFQIPKLQNLITQNILGKGEFIPPNYAYTKFMADYKRHTGGYPPDELFPSSEIDRTDPSNVHPKSSADNSQNIVPVLVYPMRNGITFEWDMEDNFKAGDFIDTAIEGGDTVPEAYLAQQPARYCDIFGRADLMQFSLFRADGLTLKQSQGLPRAVAEDDPDQVNNGGRNIDRSNEFAAVSGNNAVALDKDNREAISCNLQINLLYDTSEFVTFANLFGTKDSELKAILFDRRVSMFDETVPTQNNLADSITVTATNTANGVQIRIDTSGFDPAVLAEILPKVKSIALYQDNAGFGRHCYIARNVEGLNDSDKLGDWFISAFQF